MPRGNFKNARPFRETCLGKLPAELRDDIYRRALTLPDTRPEASPWIYLRRIFPQGDYRKEGPFWYSPMWHDYKVNPKEWLGLLLSCRQIHQETVHIFYQVNKLAFDKSSYLVKFSEDYPNRFALLTSIHFQVREEGPLELMKALARCSNLRHLSIELWSDARKQAEKWLELCDTPEIKKAIGAVRGLERVEFSDGIMKEWHQCRHAGCLRYQCPKDNFDWNPYYIGVAEEIRRLMLRPKLVSGDMEPKAKSNPLNRKREIVDVTEEDKDIEEKGRAKRRL